MATQIQTLVNIFCRYGLHFRYLPANAKMIYGCRGDCKGSWVRTIGLHRRWSKVR